MNSNIRPFFDTFNYFASECISDFVDFNLECTKFSTCLLYGSSIPKKLPSILQLGFSLYSPMSSTKYDGSFSCSLSRASRNTLAFINQNRGNDETALLDVKIRKEKELINRLFYSLHSGELLFEK
mgnify:FL=1